MQVKRSTRTVLVAMCVVGVVALIPACTTESLPSHQIADDGWDPVVASPAYGQGDGPVVLVDAAHGNWHTIDGRFKPFAELLENDGFTVRSNGSKVTTHSLDGVDIFVIANAVKGGEDSEWILPTPPAFDAGEIQVIVDWVDNGGSLLLIADHMPFPGSVSELAGAFGVEFLNGFAKSSLTEGGTLTFSQTSATLTDHPILRGRSTAESIPTIKSFTGQAFRIVGNAQPLMLMPDDWQVFLPQEAWVFSEETPSVSASGLVQGAVLMHGKGRVAVFGEAAMFTAQFFPRDGQLVRVGMNDPEAPHNAQFVLNVVHWLSGLLDE